MLVPTLLKTSGVFHLLGFSIPPGSSSHGIFLIPGPPRFFHNLFYLSNIISKIKSIQLIQKKYILHTLSIDKNKKKKLYDKPNLSQKYVLHTLKNYYYIHLIFSCLLKFSYSLIFSYNFFPSFGNQWWLRLRLSPPLVPLVGGQYLSSTRLKETMIFSLKW